MSRTVNKYDLNNGKVLEITNYELLEGVVFKKIYKEKCGKPTPLGVGWIACF